MALQMGGLLTFRAAILKRPAGSPDRYNDENGKYAPYLQSTILERGLLDTLARSRYGCCSLEWSMKGAAILFVSLG